METHLTSYRDNASEYVSATTEILSNKDLNRSVSNINKGRIIATFLSNKNQTWIKEGIFDLPEILTGCQILDARREIKQNLIKRGKIESEMVDADKKRKRRLKHKLKHLNDRKNKLNRLIGDVRGLSLTSSKVKIVVNWIRSLTKEQLFYRALMFDRKPWCELADLCHPNPKDFAYEWFLPYCFQPNNLPKESDLYRLKNGSVDELCELYKNGIVPYEYIRLKFSNHIPDNLAKEVARKENLRTLIWYHHELPYTVNPILAQRLRETDLDLPYSKIVDITSKLPEYSELYSVLVGVAEKKLRKYTLTLPSPVVVFGDASASMQVAIRTSGIISSLLCAMSKAKLHLFNQYDTEINSPPRSVKEALRFNQTMKARGCTCPAVSLKQYYDRREVVKTFFVVSDEEENTPWEGAQSWNSAVGEKFFSGIFRQYIRQVYKAKCIFITFTDKPHDDGIMVHALKSMLTPKEFTDCVSVYKFSKSNPDLRKFDAVLADLAEYKSSESEDTTNSSTQVSSNPLVVESSSGRPQILIDQDLFDSMLVKLGYTRINVNKS